MSAPTQPGTASLMTNSRSTLRKRQCESPAATPVATLTRFTDAETDAEFVIKAELPEVKTPTQPREWKKINSITISFGHGVSTTPLQTAVAGAALINGGKLINPTFLPRTAAEVAQLGTQVVTDYTVESMRYLYRLNAEKGSGKRAEVPGYRVGGKTGTAEKVVNGRYSSDKRFNAFVAAFPMDNPQYIVLSIIDEPKPEKPGMGATAGSNAAPIVANIIRRSASMLGVKPEFGHENQATLVSYQ